MAELEVLQGGPVGAHDAFDHENMGIVLVAVDWEAVGDLAQRVEGRHCAFGSETIDRYPFIVVKVKKNVGNFLQGMLINTFSVLSNVV